MTTRLFNWAGSLLAPAAAEWGKGKIGEYVANASRELGVLTDEQYATMTHIFESVKEGDANQAHTDLDSLAAHISAQEYVDLRTLIDANNTDEVGQWVTAKRDYAGTAGLVRKAANTFFSTMTEQARKHLGAWYENFRAPAPELDAFSEALQGMSQPQVKRVQRSEQEVEQAILVQRHVLIQNTTQMAMAKTVLGWACGIQNLTKETVISYIEDAAQNGADFRDVVFNEIDKADNVNGLRKFLAKACYVILEPIIGFYVHHFTENFLAYFRSQLDEFNNGHFTHALNRSVKFLNGHLQTVEGAYVRAADHPRRNADIDDLIKHDLEGEEFNGNMTPEQLFVRVAEESIERFAPVSSLRARVSDALAVRIPDDSNWTWLNYPIGAVTGLVTLTLTPFFFLIEWGGNALAKATLKKLAADLELIPSLVASTGHAVGMGEDYKHVLNELMVRQLEMAWELMNAHADESSPQIDLSAFERTLSDTTRANLKSFVSSLFLDLGYTLHSDNPAALKAYVEGQRISSMPESLKALCEALGIPLDIQEEAKETTVKYLALLLSTILKKETLSELTLTSLTTLNQSCFTLNGQRPTKEQMAATEARRNKLLSDIINTAIRQAVNDKFYPMQRIQKEANQFVRQMHLDVEQFDTLMGRLKGDGHFSEMLTTYNQFIVARDRALSSQQGSSNVNNHSLTNFNAISKALMTKLAPMQAVLATLSQCEQRTALATTEREALTSLNNIFTRLTEDHSHPDARAATLHMIWNFERETSADLQHFLGQIKPIFTEIVQAMNDWSSAQEAVLVAQHLRPMIERGDSYRQIIAAIGAYQFVSPLAETLRQTLYTQARAGTLTADNLQTMITSNGDIVQRCTETLARHAKLTETTIQPLSEARTKTLAEMESQIKAQVEILDGHSATLAKWASEKGAIESQITALQKPADKDTPEWNTEILQPFQCQNTFPIDLTAFADTVREFVVRQIAAYTHAIPLFYTKEYNWEALMRRLMVAFVQDQRHVVPAPVVN